MQDLGRIVIDINEKGSGGETEGISGMAKAGGTATAAAEELGMAANTVALIGELSVVAAGIGAAFGALYKASVEVGKALLALNRFVLEVANDLRDYSPGIQLAEMQNQIAMVATRFRDGMQYGGAIGAQMMEVGRIERAFVELKSALGAIGAIFLRPITKMVADMAEVMRDYIPKLFDLAANIAMIISTVLNSIAQDLTKLYSFLPGVSPGLFGSAVGGNIVLSVWAQKFADMATSLRAIKRNTDPKIDYGAMNQPFLADLKLMGMKGI